MNQILYEFEDGEPMLMTTKHICMEYIPIILKPRRIHKKYPETLQKIQQEYAQGLHPKKVFLSGVYLDEDGGEWIKVWDPKDELGIFYKTEYWGYH